jgi:hypothetical protein
MMTKKEQEEKVFSELSKIKVDVEDFIGKKITRKNFKKAIVELTQKIAASESDDDTPAEFQKRVSSFFEACHACLGDVIWSELKEKGLVVKICYEDQVMSIWNIPIKTFFVKQDNFTTTTTLMAKSLLDCMVGFFLSPNLRSLVMEGDQDAIKTLYNSFNRPSANSTIINLKMMRDNFPEFYEHITTKLDVMTVEGMEKYAADKLKREKKSNVRKKNRSINRA